MFGSQENSGVVPAYLRVWKEEWIHSAKLSNWSHPHTDTLATRHRQSILAPTQQHQTATQLAHSSPTPLQHHRSLSALRPSPARASRSVIVVHCPLPIAHCPSPVTHPSPASQRALHAAAAAPAPPRAPPPAPPPTNQRVCLGQQAPPLPSVGDEASAGAVYALPGSAATPSGACSSSQRGACVCRPAVGHGLFAGGASPTSHCGLHTLLTWNHLLTADRSQPIPHSSRRHPSKWVSPSALPVFPPLLGAPSLITSPHLTTPTSPTWPDLLHSSCHPPPQYTHPLLSTSLLGLSFFPSCIATHHHRPHPSSTSLSRAPTDTSTSPGDRDRDYVRIP